MSIHSDTLQGLQEALLYVKGDKTQGQSEVVETPDESIIALYDRLDDNDKYLVVEVIQRLLAVRGNPTA